MDVRHKSIIIANPIYISNASVLDMDWCERRKVIVNCSRLVPQKNLSLLIEAFFDISKDYPDYKLELYGEGCMLNSLKRQVDNLNIKDKVVFCGFKRNVIELIRDAALYVSTSDYEGISNSMLEAMAVGIPVICTDCPVGGARMVIENRTTGMLVPVGDKRKVVFAIKDVLSDSNYANELSHNATSICKKYSSEVITEQWMKYINTVLEQ